MRNYHQVCGLARALDVVGERWTLLLVRDLLLGPRRYGEMLDGLPGLTPNLLAKRLREMEAAGILERAGARYRLTPRGAALEPALLALGAWGAGVSGHADDRKSLRWALVSLKRRYVGGHNLLVELRLPEIAYTLRFTPERMDAKEGHAPGPDLIIRGTEEAFLQLFFGDASEPLEWEGRADEFRAALQLST